MKGLVFSRRTEEEIRFRNVALRLKILYCVYKNNLYISMNNVPRIQFPYVNTLLGARGGVVVKALRYKPAGRGFDSRRCHWNFSVT
jgi:hypothetical protein